MNHRSKLLALTAVAAVAGLGVFVSSGIGGDSSVPDRRLDRPHGQRAEDDLAATS